MKNKKNVTKKDHELLKLALLVLIICLVGRLSTIQMMALKRLTRWIIFLMLPFCSFSLHAATPPATLITNTVSASYSLQGTAVNSSASVDIQTVSRTPSTIAFFSISDIGTLVSLPPTSFATIPATNANFSSNGSFSPIAEVTLIDGTLTALPASMLIEPATQYTVNEPIVIEVRDIDQNLDSHTIESIFVTVTVPETGDTEIILLTETTPSSGIFLGVMQTVSGSSTPFNGLLTVIRDAKITVNYQDSLDSKDISATAALVEPIGNISLSKTTSTRIASVGDTLSYTLSFNSNNFPNGLQNLEIKDQLPPGFRYINETARLNGTQLTDNQVIHQGRSVRFVLGTMPAQSDWEIKYRVSLGAGIPRLQATNTAQAFADGEQSFVASATIKITDELLRDTAILTGRVLHGCEKDAPVINRARIYIETGQSTHTDTEGFWHLEGITAGTHLVALDPQSLPKGLTPLLCTNNTQFAGKADSQFVDIKGGTLWRADFHVQGDVEVTPKPLSGQAAKTVNPLHMFDDEYTKTATAGFEILWPPENFVPPIASISIAIKHSPKRRIELTLNGQKVNALNYHGSSSNKQKTLRVSRWRGVDIDIHNRENKLKIVVKDSSGKIIKETSRLIHFSGEPAFASLQKDQSVLLADGSSTPVIAVLMKDKEGFPMRENTHIYFTVEDGQYQVLDTDTEKLDISNTNNFQGEHKVMISKGGLARIRLKPTTQSGEIRLKIKLAEGQYENIRAWLKPHVREEWIMLGLAEGTLGYNTLAGNMQTLTDLEKEDQLTTRGRVAFFAKGKVKGSYLLTLAYDSAKKRGDIGEHLDGNVDLNAFYTIYGDNTLNQYEANSSSKLFIKLEREQFFILFGDFRTHMIVTELSRYERTLHGVHSERKGRNYHYNLSVSETKNRHRQDEIPGDGTSGEYLLSHPVIPNSEVVILETRDRFHPEKILSQRLLALHADYEIDYDSHSLFFKFPITSRDFNLNPNFIVVDYESETSARQSITASGRVAYLTDDGKTELGVSLVHEKNASTNANDDLAGIDLTYKLDSETEVKAEIAHSDTQKSGKAWLLEARKKSSQLTGRVYIRQQDAIFGLEQQNVSERGTRKYGIDGQYHINNKVYLQGDLYRQINLDNNHLRDQLSVELGKKSATNQFAIGLRHTREITRADDRKGTLLTLGGAVSPGNKRLTLRTHIEKNIAGNGANEAFPDRLLVGADIGLTDGIALFFEHEITRSDDIDTTTNRIGLSSKLWEGASIKSSLNQENQFSGERTYATVGLAQHINLSEKLSADLSVDHSETMKNTQLMPVDTDQPAINGSLRDDFTAFSIGLGWREKEWSWTSRLELRDGDREDKKNLRFGLIRQLSAGKDISAKMEITRSNLNTGEENNKALLSLGSAWHPQGNDYTVLQRLDFISEEKNGVNEQARSRKIIHNIHVNKKIALKTQASLHHGIKHTLEDEFNEKYSTTVDTAQLQVRRNVSEKMDMGLHAGYLHDWKTSNWEYNYGGSVGFTPAENTWLSVGYNLEGFFDNDFDHSDYTAQGPFLQLRYRADKDQLDKLLAKKASNLSNKSAEEDKK